MFNTRFIKIVAIFPPENIEDRYFSDFKCLDLCKSIIVHKSSVGVSGNNP